METYHKKDLLDFLDYASSKGLIAKNTATAYRSACNAILSDPDDESEDLSDVDMERVAMKFTNLNGFKYKPDSLQTYLGRFDKLNKEYRAYRDNPMSYKPTQPHRSTSSRKTPRQPTNSDRTVGSPVSLAHPEETESGHRHPPSRPEQIVHYFPLRQDVIVEVTGIPFDVKKSEMGRFTAFLSNLVPQEDELQSQQQMLPLPPEDEQSNGQTS